MYLIRRCVQNECACFLYCCCSQAAQLDYSVAVVCAPTLSETGSAKTSRKSKSGLDRLPFSSYRARVKSNCISSFGKLLQEMAKAQDKWIGRKLILWKTGSRVAAAYRHTLRKTNTGCKGAPLVGKTPTRCECFALLSARFMHNGHTRKVTESCMTRPWV